MEIKYESCVEQAVVMGPQYMLWMPTISNAIRQMDQSPGLHQAKISWSRDHWISVSPTERGRRLACMSPQASLSLPLNVFPFLFHSEFPLSSPFVYNSLLYSYDHVH